jgi:hypothetical protein
VDLLHNPLLLCLVGVGHCDADRGQTEGGGIGGMGLPCFEGAHAAWLCHVHQTCEVVGFVDHLAAGAVVDGQVKRACAGKILMERVDIFWCGAAEAEDGLPWVTHHPGRIVRPAEETQQGRD